MPQLLKSVDQKPTVLDVLPMIQRYYTQNPAGGCLHIVLDDGNVGDHSVRFCLDQAITTGDFDAVDIAKNLLLMSKTQRKKLSRCPRDQRQEINPE